MPSETEVALRNVLSADVSFYQRAHSVVQLLTGENVAEVMRMLPADFYEKFLRYAEQVYAPTSGERLVIGRRLPDTAIAAVRAWLRAQNSETLVQHVDAVPRVPAARPPRVVEVVATGWMAG